MRPRVPTFIRPRRATVGERRSRSEAVRRTQSSSPRLGYRRHRRRSERFGDSATPEDGERVGGRDRGSGPSHIPSLGLLLPVVSAEPSVDSLVGTRLPAGLDDEFGDFLGDGGGHADERVVELPARQVSDAVVRP